MIKNKIPITVYLDPETYRAMNDMRNPKVPQSVFAGMIIEETLGIVKA